MKHLGETTPILGEWSWDLGLEFTSDNRFMKSHWLVMKIGCIVYVPMPKMLKSVYKKQVREDDPSHEEILVLFMN